MKTAIALLAVLLVAADKPKEVKTFRTKADVDAFVPKELWGTENRAEGERFDRNKLNKWLDENAPGHRIQIDIEFDGVVEQVEESDVAGSITKEDVGKYAVTVSTYELRGMFLVPASKKAWVSSWKKGDKLTGTVVVRTLLYANRFQYVFLADGPMLRHTPKP